MIPHQKVLSCGVIPNEATALKTRNTEEDNGKGFPSKPETAQRLTIEITIEVLIAKDLIGHAGLW